MSQQSLSLRGAKAPGNHQYTLHSLLSKGGFASVYLASNEASELVAVKHVNLRGLPASKRETRVQAFWREVKYLGSLQHPNLVQLLDFFRYEHDLYLVMEYIEGCTLETYIEECGGSIPLEEVLDIGIQLCTVLEYLHKLEPPLIFRDLKPANVMRRHDGRIVLVDFGIARVFKEGQARDTKPLGSIGYSGPEQYGKQTDERSDLFGLGATLYTLLTGKVYGQPPHFSFPRLYWYANPVGDRLGWLLHHLVNYDMRHRHFCASCLKEELQHLLCESQTTGLYAESRPHSHPPLSTDAITSASLAYAHPDRRQNARRNLPSLWVWGIRIALILGIGLILGIVAAAIQAALH
jgi:serine/threonine protein kinase